MKEFTPKEFLDWNNGKLDFPITIVGGPNCPKCQKLSTIIEEKKWENVAKFVQKLPVKGSGYDVTAKVLQDLKVLSVPSILYTTKTARGKTEVVAKPWNEKDDMEFDTWFTAIINGDKEFFGVNEFNEVLDPYNVDVGSVRLIEALHGIDKNSISERRIMQSLFKPDIETI